MTAISKNVYINKLSELVDEYSNTIHRSTKKKPIDVKPNTYVEADVELNTKKKKFKVGGHV